MWRKCKYYIELVLGKVPLTEHSVNEGKELLIFDSLTNEIKCWLKKSYWTFRITNGYLKQITDDFVNLDAWNCMKLFNKKLYNHKIIFGDPSKDLVLLTTW